MTIDVKFSENSRNFTPDFREIQTITQYVGGEAYIGAYDITPKVDGQTLPTKNKVLIDDVKIKAIPFFETGNTSGGNTVYIANEV